jgi:hypothetical protein
MGILPRRKDWEEGLLIKERKENREKKIDIIKGKTRKHSDYYYTFKYFWGDLRMIPGLHKFGLDFLFTLKPKPFLDKRCLY